MTEQQFKEKIKTTGTFISFPKFKQDITLKRKNVAHLSDLLGQAERLGIEYLKQNQNISQSDVKLVNDLL